MSTQAEDPLRHDHGTSQPTDATMGEGYDPFETYLDDPYALYRQARQENPVFFAPAISAWVLTRHADIRYALAHTDLFSSANALRPLTPLWPATVDILAGGYPRIAEPTTADGDAHRRLRAPIAKAFASARISAARPLIRQRAAALIEAFAFDGHAELMRQLAYPLPVQVICYLLGIGPEHVEQVAAGSYDSVRVVASRRTADDQAHAAHGLVALQRLCGHYAITRPLPSWHLAFAAGAHHCAGAVLARTELAVTLNLLTHRLPGLYLADQAVAIEPTMTTRGPTALHVAW